MKSEAAQQYKNIKSYLIKEGLEKYKSHIHEGMVKSSKSQCDRWFVSECSLAGQHKCSVPFFWNETGLGNGFMLPTLEKW